MIWFLFDIAAHVAYAVPTTLRIPCLFILALALWACNLLGLEAAGVPFRSAFGLRRTDAGAGDLLRACRTLTVILIGCLVLHHMGTQAARLDVQYGSELLFWVAAALLVMFSHQKIFVDVRHTIRERAWVVFRGKEIRFADVMIGDALTSLSTVLSECSVLGCTIYCFMTACLPEDCKPGLAAPILSSIPFAIRAWHCYLDNYHTGNRLQLINLAKYLCVFPTIWIAALRHRSSAISDEYDNALETMWLYAISIATIFSFSWDVFMDWGLGWSVPAGQQSYFFLRPNLLYRSPLIYYAALVVNMILRLAWCLRLSIYLQQTVDAQGLTLFLEVMELFRRFIWNFFRVEWECVKENLSTERPHDLTSVTLDGTGVAHAPSISPTTHLRSNSLTKDGQPTERMPSY